MRTKEGLEVVAVNPVKPETLDVTGGRWIAPLPGTDAAFALGLVHTLLAMGRADRHFLETRTTGFETLEACLNGRLDGVVRDAAWANRHLQARRRRSGISLRSLRRTGR